MTIRSFLRVMAVLATAALAACQSNAPPLEPTVSMGGGAYRLGPGDKIKLTVFGQEQLSGEFAVDGGGKVAVPLIGSVEAQGLSATELETRIAQTLANGYVRDPRVNVEVLNFRPFYIIGEVNKPGQYPYVNGMTAVSAAALAGGFTYRADQDYVLITRTIDGKKQERKASLDTPILPDDVVKIPERYF